jgi:hypothetical protein
MAQENEALVIVEEGTDVEVQMESLACCRITFVFLY